MPPRTTPRTPATPDDRYAARKVGGTGRARALRVFLAPGTASLRNLTGTALGRVFDVVPG